MKKIWTVICMITVSFSVVACSKNLTEEKEANTPKVSESISTISKNENIEATQAIIKEKENMFDIKIVVGEQNFSAILYDNETTRALIEQFPMTLNMQELNGNEKYYYLPDSLPTNASRPSSIQTGDFMLYGNNCLVLFYENFSTSYNYTPLGWIDNSDELAEALGSGDVQVIFQVN